MVTGLLCSVLAAAACSSAPGSPSGSSASGRPGGSRPNFVFVLTDDLSWNLVSHMPHVLALEKAGMTMSRYYVVDSLCCPSRSAIFTGEYPHDDGVFTNLAATAATTRTTSTATRRNRSRWRCRSPATAPR